MVAVRDLTNSDEARRQLKSLVAKLSCARMRRIALTPSFIRPPVARVVLTSAPYGMNEP